MKLKINFVDFWPNFNKTDNYFFHLLKLQYDVVIDEQDPDLLFFSVDYSKSKKRDQYTNKRCKKIFYTGENVRPNLYFPGSIEYQNYSVGKADYAFTFDVSPDPRNFRLPLWVLFINWFGLKNPSDTRDPSYLIPLQNLVTRKNFAHSKFCNFVFSNTSGERVSILEELQKYKNIDCAGSLRNNMNWFVPGRGDQEHKVNFLKDYKFTIAAENSSTLGYTTEKMIHPLSVGSVPIYWGSDGDVKDFNPKCFVNVSDFKNLKELRDYIEFLDKNDKAHREILEQPIFKEGVLEDIYNPDSVLRYFKENIIC